MKTVSFLIPTRNSIEMLTAALGSITDTCTSPGDIEILLRIDDDDQPRIDLIPELKKEFKVKCVVGPRNNGYDNMGTFISDLVRVADSKWCWLFDDDAWVSGDWYFQLDKILCDPVAGPAVNSEFYILGGSCYRNGATGGPPGIIIPTKLARTIKHRNPVDQQWLDVVMQNGWTVLQLPGVTYHHDGRPR